LELRWRAGAIDGGQRRLVFCQISRQKPFFLEELGVPAPDHMLGVASASHAVQTARAMERIEPVLEEEINRIIADEFSEHLSLHSEEAIENLRAEGCCRRVHAPRRQHDDRHPSFFLGRRDGATLRQTSVALLTTAAGTPNVNCCVTARATSRTGDGDPGREVDPAVPSRHYPEAREHSD
jgi:hypothetical protein